jgi:hypothetical protein
MSQTETTVAEVQAVVLDLPELTTEGLDKLDRKVINIARLIKSRAKVDPTTGLREKDDGLAEATFGEGLCDPRLTYDLFKLAQEHEGIVYNANKIATGEAGIEAMKDNKDLAMVSGEVKLGNNTLSATMHRSQNVPSQEGGMTQRPVLRGALEVASTRSGVGVGKIVNKALTARAIAEL